MTRAEHLSESQGIRVRSGDGPTSRPPPCRSRVRHPRAHPRRVRSGRRRWLSRGSDHRRLRYRACRWPPTGMGQSCRQGNARRVRPRPCGSRHVFICGDSDHLGPEPRGRAPDGAGAQRHESHRAPHRRSDLGAHHVPTCARPITPPPSFATRHVATSKYLRYATRSVTCGDGDGTAGSSATDRT